MNNYAHNFLRVATFLGSLNRVAELLEISSVTASSYVRGKNTMSGANARLIEDMTNGLFTAEELTGRK